MTAINHHGVGYMQLLLEIP